MIYFSGFAFRNESELFREWLVESDYTVAGFSYGAIRALEYASSSHRRIERLILLSPAYFQEKSERFRRLQIDSFLKDREGYRKRFTARCAAPDVGFDPMPYLGEGSEEDLRYLLEYRWEASKFEELRERGTRIEIFLGGRDMIVDAETACRFFSKVGICYFIKEAGHLLRPIVKPEPEKEENNA